MIKRKIYLVAVVFLLMGALWVSAKPTLTLSIDPRTGFAQRDGLKVKMEIHSPARGQICILTVWHGEDCQPVHAPVTNRTWLFYESDEIEVLWQDGKETARVNSNVEVR